MNHRLSGPGGNQVLTPSRNLDSATGITGLSEFLKGLYGEKPNGSCPFCGLTATEFFESGTLGCGLCYSALDRELRETGFEPVSASARRDA